MADQEQIVSKPDHGDKIVLEGGTPSPRLQLFFDDITEKLNTEIQTLGSSIYTDDGTIGAGRIATITDTLSFQGGLTGFSRGSIAPTDGTVHIIDASAGIVTAFVDGSQLVVENNANGGMSFLNPNGTFSNIYFGSPALGNQAGRIFFDHQTAPNQGIGFDVTGVTGLQVFAARTLVNPNQLGTHDFEVNTLGTASFVKVYSFTSQFVVADAGTDPESGQDESLVHIIRGAGSGVLSVAPNTFPLDLVLDSDVGNGITFLGPDTTIQRITFGVPATAGKPFGPNRAAFQYHHGADAFQWYFRGFADQAVNLSEAGEFLINPQGIPVNNNTTFRVRARSSAYMLEAFSSIFLGGGRVGISDGNLAATDGLLHVRRADAVGVTAANTADLIVLETLNGTGFGMSFLGIAQANAFQNINFGNPTNNDQCQIRHDPANAVAGNNTIEIIVDGGAVRALQVRGAEVVVNVSSATASTNFRVPANANSALFLVDTLNEIVGISDSSLGPSDGQLHITKTALAGVITASTFANSIVIESSVSSGMSFLNADTTFSSINFGSPLLGNDAGVILFNHAVSPNQNLDISVAAIQAMTVFPTGVFFNVGQDTAMDFQVNTLNSGPFLRIISADDRMGLSQGVSFAPTDGILHIHDQGTAGLVTAHADADAIVLESNVATGLSILSLATGVGNLYFGSPTANNRGIYRFNHTTDFFQTVVAGVTIFQTSNTLVGISRTSLAPVHGALHIQQADAGVIAPSANADLIVLEGTGEIGMSFLVDNATGFANLNFGDPSNGNAAGQIRYDASGASWFFASTGTEMMRFNPTLGIVINETGATVHDLRVESAGSNHMFFVDSGNNRIGIADNGFAPSDGLIHVFQGGAAGVVAAHANADTLVLESNAAAGLQILIPNDGTSGNIYIGAPTTGNNSGQISYVPFTGLMSFFTSTIVGLKIDTDQNLLMGLVAAAATSSAGALHIPNDTSPTAVLANGIVIGSKDSGAGGTLAVPELWIEEPPEVIGTFTPSHKFKVWINGVEYFIQLDAV